MSRKPRFDHLMGSYPQRNASISDRPDPLKGCRSKRPVRFFDPEQKEATYSDPRGLDARWACGGPVRI